MKRILLIGHEATRTGAPVVLLHLIRWLRENTDLDIQLLLLSGGELVSAYRDLVPVFVLPDPGSSIVSRGFRKLKEEMLETRSLRTKGLEPFKTDYDLVMGNTAITLEYLRYFKKRGAKTICWMHELEYIIKTLFTVERFTELTSSVDMFVGGSGATVKMLRGFGIEKPVEVVYDFSAVDRSAEYNVDDIRAGLGIPADAFVVAGSGTLEWRKGVDLFLQTAVRQTGELPDIYFIWVAGRSAPTNPTYNEVMFDLARIDEKERVRVIESTESPAPYFAAADLFLLTSREDTFPLVCLESAALGKPVICFENAGGMPEFIGEDAGAVVPYLDIEALSSSIRAFYDDRNTLKRAGDAARAKVETKFSLENSCRRISEIIDSI